ncbi:unnamed protein product [Ambrosiozyma monospora]|uniref:Elongator complex protein 2 n=1 Tax=Ambrosiozyma monospora TaxID=43982 RepID=A0A9W7DGS7_AMBMO|nr:unnamed protein product [Ambrosiozyma monospora]
MVTAEATFAGCNRELQISDYNPLSNLVAFGSKNTVSVFDPVETNKLGTGILHTLKSHTKHVVTVKWIPGTNILISGSEDKTIKVWKYDSEKNKFELRQTLTGHGATVTTFAIFDDNLFVSGCANGELKVWLKSTSNEQNDNQSEFVLGESFTIKAGFYQLALALTQVAQSQYVLFIGGTNTNLYSYSIVTSNQSVSVNQCAVLTGHEDWIKSIAIKKLTDETFFIASGSQDRYIRLWKLSLNGSIDNSDQDKTKLTLLFNKQYKFTIESSSASTGTTTKGAISFDAIIMGHDDWISSLVWHPDPNTVKLLSGSADTTIMIWEPDTTSGIWVSKVRLGEMSIKGASTATGASGGFWCALWMFTKNGAEFILTNGKTGSFRCWENTNAGVVSASTNDESAEPNFVQAPCLTGNMKDITDLEWSPNGDYLLSTSLDQTTRLYARWVKNADGTLRKDGSLSSWHEFARPQIHGYDMICIKPLTSSTFVSGGDEKIMRSFNEPKSVANLLSKFTDVTTGQKSIESMPESASLPVLGLSNKAELDNVEQQHQNADKDDEDEEDLENNDQAKNISSEILSTLQTPPLEDHLQRHTLWPETEKLYGHGYEITTLDISSDGKLIASACRSNVASHAVIRIFRTDTWLQLPQTLAGHELTITRLRWSLTGDYLLAVSRDRQFSLWQRNHAVDGNDDFKLIKLQNKAHSRIVWDCCWLPSGILSSSSSAGFVTGSRDRFLKLWEKCETADENGESVKLVGSVRLTTAITSLDSYSKAIDGKCVISVGLENGGVLLYSVDGEGKFELLKTFEEELIPSDRVSRVSFRKPSSSDEKDPILLAVGSVDNSVRIFSIDSKELSV